LSFRDQLLTCRQFWQPILVLDSGDSRVRAPKSSAEDPQDSVASVCFRQHLLPLFFLLRFGEYILKNAATLFGCPASFFVVFLV